MDEQERRVTSLSREGIDLSQVPDRPKLDIEDRIFAMDVLEEAIAGMSDRQKLCLLPMLGGYATDEIAERLGLPQQTVEELLEDAFKRIREVARGRVR